MIIPFFIPHAGCPNQCVFCDQKKIIGQDRPAELSAIPRSIDAYLNTARGKEPVQIAFYGGSFTALPVENQRAYLEMVRPYLVSKQVQTIRLSTRPDAVTSDIIRFLKYYNVTTVELGAQSMDDRVLDLSRRGHTSEDTTAAARLLKEHDLIVGIQLMPGLPGDSEDRFRSTVKKIVMLGPDFVRLYPALVIKGTALADRFQRGDYVPLSLECAVTWCRLALAEFETAGIPVIRIGLQSTQELERPDTILAGPYHPAFRQLVESGTFLDKMRSALTRGQITGARATFHVNAKDMSAVIGQHRLNLHILKREFGLRDIKIVPDPLSNRRGEITLLSFS